MLMHFLRDEDLFRQVYGVLLPEHLSKPSEIAYHRIWKAATEYYEQHNRLPNCELLFTLALSGFLEEPLCLADPETGEQLHANAVELINFCFDKTRNPDDSLEPEAALDFLKALLRQRTVGDVLRTSVQHAVGREIHDLAGLVDRAYSNLQEIEAIGSAQSTMMDSEAFATENFQQSWLIEDVLVENQAMVIGGPEKAMKTSIAMDLAVSLGIGESARFLNRFPVGRQVRVGFYSGEMGKADIQARYRRILQAKSRTPAECLVFWSFDLPRVGEASGLRQLAIDIVEKNLDVIFIDPLYLALQSGDGDINHNDMYQIGPLLQAVNRTCDELGCTLVLIHHTRKSAGKEPLQLQDLAHSGVPQFARQWLLVNRTEPFDAETGVSELGLSISGSSGHCGQYAVDINEGTLLGGNLASRPWTVTVRSRTAQISEQQRRKQEKNVEELDKDWKKIWRFLYEEHLDDGETRRQIELNTDLSRARVKKIIDAKVASGNLILDVRPKPAGNTTKDQTVYILSPPFKCLIEERRRAAAAEQNHEVAEESVES